MVARLKLKGIDGGSHKRWSMWLNSRLREEPYPGLDMVGRRPAETSDDRYPIRSLSQVLHGCRQLVSCDVGLSPITSETLVSSCHHSVGHSSETAGVKPEEGGDDVKSSWPLCPGLHTCYNGVYKGMQNREIEQIPKNTPQFRLEAATRLHAVGIAR